MQQPDPTRDQPPAAEHEERAPKPPVDRPDPEDPPTGPAEELTEDFDPAAAPSNPDLVGPDPDALQEESP